MKIETKDVMEVMERHLREVKRDLDIVETEVDSLDSVLSKDKLISN